jgi:hypothetical protein
VLSGNTYARGCPPGAELDGTRFTLTSPVPVVEGRFHAQGTSLGGHSEQMSWSLDAIVSPRRTILGRVAITGPNSLGVPCSVTLRVAAIIPPDNVPQRSGNGFQWTSSGHPRAPDGSVTFDLKRGVVRHLKASLVIRCPDGAMTGGGFYSTAYRLDPIPLSAGRFRIEADALDDDGVVTHLLIRGRISGRSAAGTVDSSRFHYGARGTKDRCTQRAFWKARYPRAYPPRVGRGGAYYAFDPERVGGPGAWKYYFSVYPYACSDGVNKVRFRIVRGPTATVGCNRSTRLGPLAPKRMYRVIATGLRTRQGRLIGARVISDFRTYLPGDDACWVPL